MYGLLAGYFIGYIAQCFLFLRLILVTNWGQIAIEAAERIQGEQKKLSQHEEDGEKDDHFIKSP